MLHEHFSATPTSAMTIMALGGPLSEVAARPLLGGKQA
jgi:hypothetical protein